MKMKGVDDAISDLAYEQKIPENDFHTSSVLHNLDVSCKYLEYPPEKLLATDSKGDSPLSYAIDYIASALERSEYSDLKKIDDNLLLVSLAELYRVITQNEPQISDNQKATESLSELFSEYPFVKDIFTKWDKDNKGSDK